MIVEASHIIFSHQEATSALLNDISFSLPEGSLTCLCGQNGEGKSTLLALLCGIYAQNSGQISVAGFPLPDKIKALRGHVALTPQDPDLYILGASAREDLLLSIPKSANHARNKAVELAERFGLGSKLDMPVHHLSFGEKRKLCLASSLAGISGKPLRLLLLDEPFAGLDYPSALAVRDIVKANKKEGLSQIIISHDLEYIIDLTDRCLILKSGKLFFDGSPEDAMPLYKKAGIRPPLPCQYD